MYQISTRQTCVMGCYFLKIVATCVLALLLMSSLQNIGVQADGTITVKVVDLDCRRPGHLVNWSYSSVETAVKDTIPGEWGPPLNPLTYEVLKEAAVQIRSRIMWNDANPLSREYDYSTAYVDYPAGETLPSGCNDYTMNTIYNGRRHSNTSNYPYNSNGAADATAGRHIVTRSGSAAQVAFNPDVQWATVNCCEQSCASGSDDWEFCVLSSLAAAVNWGGNRYVRRLNDRPYTRVVFQAEAFAQRIQPRSGHYWFCYTSSGGWTGKCYMQAVPDNGTGFGSDTSYWSLSPEMRYKVPFPAPPSPTPVPTTWYVWVRGMGGSYDNDSLHVGLDNQPVSSASDVTGYQWHTNQWSWESIRMNGQRPYVTYTWSEACNNTSCGAFHTLNIWMREDGMRVDKIILTSDPNYVP